MSQVCVFVRNTAQWSVWDLVRDFDGIRGFDGHVNIYILILYVVGLSSLVAGYTLNGGVKDGGGSRFVRNLDKPPTTLHSVRWRR
jgi:hypothetical protein